MGFLHRLINTFFLTELESFSIYVAPFYDALT